MPRKPILSYHTRTPYQGAIVRNGNRERRIMSQENFGTPSSENPAIDAASGMSPKDKTVWSSPTVTRLDGKETQGIAPPGSNGAPARKVPEEMIFFGS